MTLDIDNDDFSITDPDSLWFGYSLFDLYKQAYTPWEWHEPIVDLATKLGLVVFSSPFDDDAIDFLEELDMPAYKIASFECIDLPLIRKAASTGKPLIISTGMATISEIADAVETARNNGCSDLILLKCTSSYPASPEKTNLKTISHMKDLFNCEVGISDHTLGIGVAVAAVSFGASLIEKHFTLDRSEGGVDAAFSIEPQELQNLADESKRAWQAVGSIDYGQGDSEEGRHFRRSLYIGKDMSAGEVLTKESLRRVRPGYGLPPKYFDLLLGKKIKKAVLKGTPASFELLE